MTKTIEEAAREFMQSAPIEAISPYYEEDMIEMFKGGVEYALSLPLASRLTAEEKERVREAYKAMSDYGKNKGVECASCANYAARVWMERIFGKDFFKEGE